MTMVRFPLETLFHKFKPSLSFAGAPWWTYSLGKRFSTFSCDSLIEKPVDALFVHHHETSTKSVDKRDGGSSNKVETFVGPTMGGESNHESENVSKKSIIYLIKTIEAPIKRVVRR